MKQLKLLALSFALAGIASGVLVADDKPGHKKEKAKAYPLKKCLVSDEELGGHGDPYVFIHEGQEIKMCCKSCLKDFKKDTAKYMKKLNSAAKAEK